MADEPKPGENAEELETELEEAEDPEVDEVDPDAEGPEDEPDAGGEGDEVEGDEGKGQARQVAPTRRGSPRVQALANENRDLKSKLSDFERQLREISAQAGQRQPTQAEIAEQERREQEALELMTPAQVAAYYHQKTLRIVEQQTNQTRAHLFEQTDRQQYDGLLAQNPAYRRYDDKVAELKRQAPGVPRQILLATAIGMRAMEGSGAAKTRQAKAAETQAARHRAAPSQARADVPASRRERSGDDLEQRLTGVSI